MKDRPVLNRTIYKLQWKLTHVFCVMVNEYSFPVSLSSEGSIMESSKIISMIGHSNASMLSNMKRRLAFRIEYILRHFSPWNLNITGLWDAWVYLLDEKITGDFSLVRAIANETRQRFSVLQHKFRGYIARPSVWVSEQLGVLCIIRLWIYSLLWVI